MEPSQCRIHFVMCADDRFNVIKFLNCMDEDFGVLDEWLGVQRHVLCLHGNLHGSFVPWG